MRTTYAIDRRVAIPTKVILRDIYWSWRDDDEVDSKTGLRACGCSGRFADSR